MKNFMSVEDKAGGLYEQEKKENLLSKNQCLRFPNRHSDLSHVKRKYIKTLHQTELMKTIKSKKSGT